ncbi:MAG: xanthine dehydrogenase family protein molybdopterin-binding subunit [Acidobacteria bacterium]|nr:xanthine dehydrogenase family protein molybdopterin-binding subunit [Acidobacteriota bacterium]
MTEFTRVPKQVEDAMEKWNGTTSRRDFLKGSGLMVVSFSAAAMVNPNLINATASAAVAEVNPPAGPYKDPDFRQLDSWIVIRQDNTAAFYVGKTDCGQGTGTAFRQIMADELDMAFDKTDLIMGNTETTVDQGGSGGSDAIRVDGWPMRRVAAEARRVLLEMASKQFGAPVDQFSVSEGVITVKGDPSIKVTYGELIGGKRFNVTLTGKDIDATTGVANLKPVQEHKIIGKSLPRYDIPPKVDGSLKWAVDAKVPGMVHARNVRPPWAGAKLISIDESSVRGIPGFIKVVSKGNYVAVVCEREEDAIKASRQLKVNWEKPATPSFPKSEDLYDYMRNASPTSVTQPTPPVVGNPDDALASAAKVIEAEYEFPFQGHVSFGPAHAMADPSNGQMTIYSNDMKAYRLRRGVADFLGMPQDRVRVIWMEGSQAYGRTAADDAGFEAAFLAKEVGRPVRVQWMRHEETAWDTKGPAFTFKLRGGLDTQGNLIALVYNARTADYNHVDYNDPNTVLIGQLVGRRPSAPAKGGAGPPADMYVIPNLRRTTEVVRLPLVWETPIRAGNLRDPNGPQIAFASESFIDELAAAAKADPVEFRLRLLTGSTDDDKVFTRARSIAVVKAAAAAYGWDNRPSPKALGTGNILTGRGIAYCYRQTTIVVEIAEVEVNRTTGHVWVKRLVCAHDCGLVINPDGLLNTIEGNLLHGLSRGLHEEVQFDTDKITSVDWISYPTLTHADTPAKIDIVLVNGDPNPNRPDLPPYGAGEAACRITPAAVANAIYDATGVRIRRVPFRDKRVLAALKAAKV